MLDSIDLQMPPDGSTGAATAVFADQYSRDTDRLKVFVSSVFEGFQRHREAIAGLLEALGHKPILIGENSPARPRSPQRACLNAVSECDVMVLLLGASYGRVQRSCKSATHEECERARDLGKDLLVFREDVEPQDKRQADFITEVESYEDGLSYKPFKSLAQLQEEVVRAIRHVEDERHMCAELAQRLPEQVEPSLDKLQTAVPALALADTQSADAHSSDREPETVMALMERSPRWATEPGPLVWEAVAEFLHASCIDGAHRARSLAIAADSRHRSRYLAWNAIRLADGGVNDADDSETAEGLAGEIRDDDALHAAVAAKLSGKPEQVVEAVKSNGLQNSDDPAMRELAAHLLAGSYSEQGRDQDALDALARFAGSVPSPSARIRLHEAALTLDLALAMVEEEQASHSLFERAVKRSLKARRALRPLGGPSHLAAQFAFRARMALQEPLLALEVGLPDPEGEATQREAQDPTLQQLVADALMQLGRSSEIERLNTESFKPWQRTLVLAIQARDRDDRQTASRLMHKALGQTQDEQARSLIAIELAMIGELADDVIAEQSDVDAALIAGTVAFSRDDFETAAKLSEPYSQTSELHADRLWHCQRQQGQAAMAVETLRDAVERFGHDAFAADLVDVLRASDRAGEAESAATEALSRSLSKNSRARIRGMLLDIAQDSQDWQKAYERAAAILEDDPQNSLAGWCAVNALESQGLREDARSFMLTNNLIPDDESQAHLATLLLGGPDAPDVDADRLLELAKRFPQSEFVTGLSLMALMIAGERVTLSEQQAEEARELLEGFVERFPASEILWQTKASSPQELAERTRDLLRRRHGSLDRQLLADVLAGRAPYGAICQARTYSGLLTESARAGWHLTAVSASADVREREVQAARRAMSRTVVIDTSVVAAASRIALGLTGLSKRFERVLVPDQLLVDARRAVTEAKISAPANMLFDPWLHRVMVRDVTTEETDRAVKAANAVVEELQRHRRVLSADLRPQWYPPELAAPLEWDAAVRVASVHGHALWCDDAALRHAAQAQGVETFGTYALCEALADESDSASLRDLSTLKMQMLRAHLADVPISHVELIEGTDDSDGADPAWELWLSRAATWQDALGACAAVVYRINNLHHSNRWQHIARLVQASCIGIGSTNSGRDITKAIGSLLATVLLEVRDSPPTVPEIVEAARRANTMLGQSDQLDPLTVAAECLLISASSVIDDSAAGRSVMQIFSAVPQVDRRKIAAVILQAPVAHSQPDNDRRSLSIGRGSESKQPSSKTSRTGPQASPASTPTIGQSADSAPKIASMRPGTTASAQAGDRLAESLRDRRIALGISQAHLGERCGMPRSSVRAVESSIRSTSIATVLALGRELGVSLSLVALPGTSARTRTAITSTSNLGRAIRAARGQLGWRQEDLAERAQMNRAQISKIETGAVDARTDSVLRIADAMRLVLEIDDDERAFLLDDILAERSGPRR